MASRIWVTRAPPTAPGSNGPIILLIRDMVVESCYRRFGFETIHSTQKFTSMKLMPCVITYACSFLTSEVVEAVRGQKHISAHTLAFSKCLVHPTAPVLLTKNGPLGIQIQRPAPIERVGLLTHLKFENRLRTFHPQYL